MTINNDWEDQNYLSNIDETFTTTSQARNS